MQKIALQKLFLGAILLVFIVLSSWISIQIGHGWYSDLPSFYWAVIAAFHHDASPYTVSYLNELAGLTDRKVYPFLYPPPSLIIFSPMLLCEPYNVCHRFVGLSNLLLWWWMVFASWKFYLVVIPKANEVLALCIICVLGLIFFPIIDTQLKGQVNLWVLFCVWPLFIERVGSYKEQILSSFLLSIAILLKVYCVLLLPVLLIIKQWRIVFFTVFFLIIWCVLAYFFVPITVWLDWFHLSVNGAAYGKNIPGLVSVPWNQSINGFFIRQYLMQGILSGVGQQVVLIYIVVAAVLLSLGAMLLRIKNKINGVSFCVALGLLTMILVAPLSWAHHYVLAVPVLLWVFILWRKSVLNQWGKWALAVVLLLGFLGIGTPYLLSALVPGLSALAFGREQISLWDNFLLSAQFFSGSVIFLTAMFLMLKYPLRMDKLEKG